MKHLTLTLLMALACLSIHAQAIQPILFDEADFDIQSPLLSDEQRSFFDLYQSRMERIAAGEDPEKFFVIERTEDEDGEIVPPLLGDINYNQGTPYNNKCPWMNNGRAVTGCVATAMAQVMRYWKYPEHGTGTFTYTGGTGGAKTIDLATMTFDWKNMLPTYDGVYYTDKQADAVATLMLACGAALSMNYDVDGSGANTSKVNGLLKNNFGYNKAAGFATTDNSNNPEEDIYWWGVEAVRPDLEAGRPLIFSGYPSVGKTGHCFVVDGYKIENGIYYYHVNWGWGGYGNSWCLLTKLEDAEGSNYSGHKLQMVYNIYPATQDIESVQTDNVQCTKYIQNGQLFIERNHTVYTVQGQEVK